MFAQAQSARTQETELTARVERGREALAAASRERAEAESAATAESRRVAAAAQAAADRREGLAKLAGQVAAKRSRIEAGESEIGRLSENLERASARGDDAQRRFAALEGSVAQDEEGEVGLDAEYEEAAAAVDEFTARRDELATTERDALARRDQARSRREALELSLRRKDGAQALLAAGADPAADTGSRLGVLGALPELLDVEPDRGVNVERARQRGVVDPAVVQRLAIERARHQDPRPHHPLEGGGRRGEALAGEAEEGIDRNEVLERP